MKIFVPDASVILKWVLRDEEDHDYAFALLKGWINQEHEFILPSLWLYEVGNVLGMKRPKDAERILDILLEYEFMEYRITKEITTIAFRLMRELKGVTFYDTIYHVIALRESGVMVTADKTYFEKAKGMGGILLI